MPGGDAWQDWRHGNALGALKEWAAAFAEHLGRETPIVPREDAPAHYAHWLANALAAVLDHPAMLDFVNEVQSLAARGKVAAGEADPGPRAMLAPCPSLIDTGECGELLRYYHGQPYARCKACGVEWELGDVLARLDAVWLPAGLASHTLGVTTRTLQRWAKAGQITQDEGGAYDVLPLILDRI
tara:strand:+ start:1913 stop:2464 length:552 start_codon:yes stop_codon:yes gene_type:complete